MRSIPLILLATLAYYSQESCAVRSDTATAVAYTLVQPRVIPRPCIAPDPSDEAAMPAMPPPPEDESELPSAPVKSPPPKPAIQPSRDTGVYVPQTVTVRRTFGWRLFRR